MKKAIVLALCLSLVAGLAVAREATLTRVDLDRVSSSRVEADCVVGNNDFDNILGYYGSWYAGFEDYAYHITRLHQLPCECTEGWALSAVHFLLALDVDTDIMVQAALYTAVDLGGGCWAPGVEVYASPIYDINGIPELAYYDIELEFAGEEFCQVPPSGNFFLVWRFLDDGPVYGLPISDGPLSCKNYNDYGNGWEDLVVDYGFAGNLLIWADVNCCLDSVPTQDSSWGSIKQLFR